MFPKGPSDSDPDLELETPMIACLRQSNKRPWEVFLPSTQFQKSGQEGERELSRWES